MNPVVTTSGNFLYSNYWTTDSYDLSNDASFGLSSFGCSTF